MPSTAPGHTTCHILRPHRLCQPLQFLLAYLPAWARPRIPRWGAALKISPTGQPLQLLMDPDGSHIAFVSSVTEVAGRLYFGNVRMNYVSYLDLKDV